MQLIAHQIGEGLFYYLHNAHGDVVQRISENGTSAPQYRYDAFGNEKDPKDTDPNPFRYCGEYFDLSSGECYLRARSYDPSTGRFTSADTHWNPGNIVYGDQPQKANQQPSLYSYAFSPGNDNSSDSSNYSALLPAVNVIRQSATLYKYCLDNPLKYDDASGNVAALILIGIGALVGGIVGGITNKEAGGNFWAGFIGGAAGGALGTLCGLAFGPAIGGAVSGAISGAVSSSITDRLNNRWSPNLPQKSDEEIREDAGKAAAVGGVFGFLVGATIGQGLDDTLDENSVTRGLMPGFTPGFKVALDSFFDALVDVFSFMWLNRKKAK